MRRNNNMLMMIYLVLEVVYCRKDLVDDEYENYPNRRLTNVFKTVMTSSRLECIFVCSTTDGCLAANVIGNNDITCELTTGLSNENEMQTSYNSDLLVLDYNKCIGEPRICLNNATCEKTWTSARCHCTDRYQGDRCDQCTERFQGDDCQDCSSRFQGDGCQECAQHYYGDDCEYIFTSQSDHTCSGTAIEYLIPDSSGYYDNCKEWCVARDDCGGFVISFGRCIFKDTECESNVHAHPEAILFLKTFN